MDYSPLGRKESDTTERLTRTVIKYNFKYYFHGRRAHERHGPEGNHL